MDSFDDVRQSVHVIWRRARRFSIAFQPELRGHYSSERIRDFLIYSKTTPLSWTIIVSLVSPFPCLLILVSIDAVPLASPRDGSSANYLFWLRDFVTIALMTRVILEQFRITVPNLQISSAQVTAMPVISSAGAVVFMIAMASVIGFPLPFALVVGINVMIFNVDVFNALWVALDILLGLVSLSDIRHLANAIIFLRRKIPTDNPLKTASFIEIALKVVDEDPRARSRLAALHYGPMVKSSTSLSVSNLKALGVLRQVEIPARNRKVIPVGPPRNSLPLARPIQKLKTLSLGQIPTETPLMKLVSNKERQWFLERSARTLFTTEFVILVLYTKVIIPLIYCIYTAGMFLLPNHAYYPLLQSFDADEMLNNLGRVVAFGFIELLLMLGMGYLIQGMLGISVIHLLSLCWIEVGTWFNRTCFCGFATRFKIHWSTMDSAKLVVGEVAYLKPPSRQQPATEEDEQLAYLKYTIPRPNIRVAQSGAGRAPNYAQLHRRDSPPQRSPSCTLPHSPKACRELAFK
ncbi:hypothetical protein ON010_g15962 [Phytophthora cinnamomi]|nr:hypothetical protein ON010_g15962 [Phytophthora cinnamomi]